MDARFISNHNELHALRNVVKWRQTFNQCKKEL